jgi:5-methyltetrahydropteroyltriglutamate--homocysteine methyltransferase
MTKWFNTNYHYIVPEFTADQLFRLSSDKLFAEIDAARKLTPNIKPVILGPLTYLWLGKAKDDAFDKLDLLDKIIPVYNQIFDELKKRNIEWVQIDEPILVLDLPETWKNAYSKAYHQLDFGNLKCLLTTYFGALDDNLALVGELPVHGLHIDLCAAPEQLIPVLKAIANDKVISLGIINGRNIWRADLQKLLKLLPEAYQHSSNKFWIASSSSLLHVPVDLESETKLDQELKGWLAFAKQKIDEVVLLTQITIKGEQAFAQQLAENKALIQAKLQSPRIHNPLVQKRLAQVTVEHTRRQSDYEQRALFQRSALQLPLFPTTTIGSFPQTQEIRAARQLYKAGKIAEDDYLSKMREEIASVIQAQEELDIDVLVHGEAERNDMVEYFGELLDGFAFTSHAWVQSYGSRCVKPPIIYGDVSRQKAMTVNWSQYAQSLTDRRVKGMLTGPVTILAWSFVRDDQSYSDTALQIALALRDEVLDLEQAGITVIQIDEPAIREALPLRKKDWSQYLDWAVFAFRLASSGVSNSTQIHTHMCYSEFNDIIQAIAALDADVITIESSRSQMDLLKAFESFAYPNEIGPGVYDIHSPRIPDHQEIIDNLEKATQHIPLDRLWVNPDCGLKTRDWPEVKAALSNMVFAAKLLRNKYEEYEE